MTDEMPVDGRPSTDAPLTPSVARRLIVSVLKTGAEPMKRDELARKVLELHQRDGGKAGQQPPQMIVKKALGYLREDGKVEKADGFGRWRLRGTGQIEAQKPEEAEGPLDILDEQGDESDAPALGPAETIAPPTRRLGIGSECVYVYYHPNDRELAGHNKRDVWECKVGKTESSDPTERIAAQGARTARSRPPVLALVIQTDDCSALERALHASLRLLDALVDSDGQEWFMTSPSRIELWYLAFQKALSALRNSSNDPG